MNKFKIYTIDEAIKEVRRYHSKSTERPLLVGVHGLGQDVGKTYFCKKACEKLAVPGVVPNGLVYLKNKPDFDYFLNEHYSQLEYLFYHIGFNHPNPEEFDIRYWNYLIKPFTNRNTDVNVAIFNPNFINPNLEQLVKTFDVVVSNPNSRRKRARLE